MLNSPGRYATFPVAAVRASLTLGHDVDAGSQDDQVPRAHHERLQPRDDVVTEDVVLHDGGEARSRVLVGNQGREPVAQVEEAYALPPVARCRPRAPSRGPRIDRTVRP